MKHKIYLILNTHKSINIYGTNTFPKCIAYSDVKQLDSCYFDFWVLEDDKLKKSIKVLCYFS